jgi:hypothetical protein
MASPRSWTSQQMFFGRLKTEKTGPWNKASVLKSIGWLKSVANFMFTSNDRQYA